MLVLTRTDRALGEQVAAELAGVEQRFASELLSDLPCVNRLVEHVDRYRGKMLRPTLVLVSGMAGGDGELTDGHRVVATVAEMVHMATLVHDDVLDDARVRRRTETINYLKGNEAAVMLGDYLISHAYHLCSSLGQPRINKMIADATNTVCEGELLQLSNRENLGLDERTYFQIIQRKTAGFCGMCCRLGLMLSGNEGAVADHLYGFGEKLGVAFQIVDDLLDLIGTEDTVGKSLGRDLQKGKLTLPVIHYLRSSDGAQRQAIVELLRSVGLGQAEGGAVPEPGRQDLDRIRQAIVSSGSVQYASEWAARLINQAKQALTCLGDSPARTLLLDMADAVLTRKF